MKTDFLQLYDNYFDDVYRYVYSKTGNKWDADDLVGDIFHKAYRYFSSLKEESGGKAWLMTIARNRVIDYYRRKRETLPGAMMDSIPEPEAFEERFEFAEEMECLKKSLAFLTEDDREIIDLRYFADMKHKDIGSALGKTEQFIKTRAFRLLKKLGSLVSACMEGGKARD